LRRTLGPIDRRQGYGGSPKPDAGRCAVGLLVALAMAACASSRGGAGPAPTAAPSAGRQLLDTACTTCHDLGGVERLAGLNSRADWDDIVRSMVANGAELTEAEIPVLVEYLTETYAVSNEQ
jgi:cytochrome c5